MPSSAICSTTSCAGKATPLEYCHTAQPASAKNNPTRRLAIFDPKVSDLQVLLAGLQPDVQYAILDAERDGIEQISALLEDSAASEVTIVARGFCGGLSVGASTLNHCNLSEYEHQLRNWFSDKTSACLTLLAGEVAQRKVGKAFVNQLTAITGATVRASAKPIGQGHWLTATAKTFQPLVLNTYSATL